MLLRWVWSTFSVPDAFLITFAILVTVSSLAIMAIYYFDMTAFRLFLYRTAIKLEEAAIKFDMLTGYEEDLLPMPKEYVNWASAEKWRESCIRPHERRYK